MAKKPKDKNKIGTIICGIITLGISVLIDGLLKKSSTCGGH